MQVFNRRHCCTNRIGIHSSIVDSSNVSFDILNALSDDLLMRIQLDKDAGQRMGDFTFITMKPKVRLTKGFIGIFRINHKEPFCVNFLSEWEQTGLLSYSKVISEHNQDVELISSSSAINIAYKVLDGNILMNHMHALDSETFDAGMKNEQINKQLHKEQLLHEDILMVDMVDVYRHLPLKLLLLSQAISSMDYKYLLKLDDDCFVNVDLLMAKLDSLNSHVRTWWGKCFPAPLGR
ncbi:UDP-GalNAc:beta-1,3-N-acetylgalactosaminyltransferase 2 [Halotydeus destructor]|nr:UDP-GalNAc:beta-1,3-N-acetylgalactosaminyltransferase 2 [Halotydeus destructor]